VPQAEGLQTPDSRRMDHTRMDRGLKDADGLSDALRWLQTDPGVQSLRKENLDAWLDRLGCATSGFVG
jgi:hypothetical protein